MRRIFIVGTSRSGTTLCQTTIMASGQVYSFPETHFFTTLPKTGATFEKIQCCLSWARLLIWARKNNFGCMPRPYLSRRNGIKAFAKLLDNESKRHGFDAWVEKTPSHLNYVREIAKEVPGVFLVFTVRSARENIESLVEVLPAWKKRIDEADVGYALSRWCGDIILVQFRARELHGHILDYDELVVSPNKHIRLLYDYLHLAVDDDISNMNLSKFGKKVVQNSEFWKKNNLQDKIEKQIKPGRLREADIKAIGQAVEYLCSRLNITDIPRP